MHKLALLVALVSIPVLVALGCGNDEAASSATSLAPAGSVMYAEVDLDPSGDQKQAIDELIAKFPGEGSAGERLRSLVEKGLRESDAPINFEEDVEPWLGDTAAFFITDANRGAGAALIATDDEDAARNAIEKSFEGDAREKSYEGVDYFASGDAAGGIVDGFVVAGDERGRQVASVPPAVDRHRAGTPHPGRRRPPAAPVRGRPGPDPARPHRPLTARPGGG